MDRQTDVDLSSRRLGERTAVLCIGGEVDLYNTPQLKEQIQSLIEGGVRHLLVDLSDTQYLDSTALGALIGALKRLRERDGDLRLACPPPRIRKLLEITRLMKVFEVRDDVARALAEWGEDEGEGR
ncbi:MAG: STAS domain-containing protein [Armatimonadota bacterium]|nr:MAG: STAS domain-containing protein [Armatimonadota bacterium]